MPVAFLAPGLAALADPSDGCAAMTEGPRRKRFWALRGSPIPSEPKRKRLGASPPPEGLSESAEEAGLHSSVAVVRLMQGLRSGSGGGGGGSSNSSADSRADAFVSLWSQLSKGARVQRTPTLP